MQPHDRPEGTPRESRPLHRRRSRQGKQCGHSATAGTGHPATDASERAGAAPFRTEEARQGGRSATGQAQGTAQGRQWRRADRLAGPARRTGSPSRRTQAAHPAARRIDRGDHPRVARTAVADPPAAGCRRTGGHGLGRQRRDPPLGARGMGLGQELRGQPRVRREDTSGTGGRTRSGRLRTRGEGGRLAKLRPHRRRHAPAPGGPRTGHAAHHPPARLSCDVGAGDRARGGHDRNRVLSRRPGADLPHRLRQHPRPRPGSLSDGHRRGRTHGAARRRDRRRRIAAAEVRDGVDLLPSRSGRGGQGHRRPVPDPPVRQGRAGRDLPGRRDREPRPPRHDDRHRRGTAAGPRTALPPAAVLHG